MGVRVRRKDDKVKRNMDFIIFLSIPRNFGEYCTIEVLFSLLRFMY